ncbi:MAG: hypothetical protein V7678_11930 [Brevundimonas sp.]
MKPRVEIDDARRRITVTADINVMSRDMTGTLIALVREEPRRADHDFIIDVRESYGDGSHDDVVLLAEAFRAAGAGRQASHTCFITPDPGFVHWVRTMDFCFDNRTHLVFDSPEAADAFLDQKLKREPAAA